ncbi:MAG: transcriptional regulator [Pseudomonadota bacterium]|nr:transcriptional regulator [Pseudomonadota bacterium]
MEIRPIRTDDDYRAALAEVSPLFDNEPEPGTPEGDRFDVLCTLIEAFERKHYPVAAPDPVEAIRFHMQQAALMPADLVPMIGQLNRVYEVLNRTRQLSIGMIRRLHDQLGIPAESLIGTSDRRVPETA